MSFRTTFLFIILSFSVAGQNKIYVKSKVDNTPIAFATVALLSVSDSTLLDGGYTTEDGEFSTKSLLDTSCTIVISMLGYKSIKETYSSKDLNGTSFFLAEETLVLNNVDIIAKKQKLVYKNDRISVVVENLNSPPNSVLGLMKNLPGVLVRNDKIIVAGQSNFAIFINGKSTKYLNIEALLKEMPVENIKSVELIQQPGSEFDADGTGAIINIILKNNKYFGTNGSVVFQGNTGIGYNGFNSSISLSHFVKKINITTGLSFNKYITYKNLIISRYVDKDLYEQNTIDPDNPFAVTSRFNIDYELTKKQRIGLNLSYQNNWLDRIISNNTSIKFFDTLSKKLLITTNNQSSKKWNLLNISPNYEIVFDSVSNHKLLFDVNYIYYSPQNNSLINSIEKNTAKVFNDQLNNASGISNILSSKIDYNNQINKHLTFQSGLKISSAKLDNELKSFLKDSNLNWVNNSNQSNRYLFNENIFALYTKLNFSHSNWNGFVGLRFENSKSIGNSITIDSVNKRVFNKLFPSVSITRKISKEFDANLGYNYRIERPNYSTLNPFVYYYDPYTFEKGNPFLFPVLAHNFRFGLLYNSQPFFNVEYKINSNSLVEVTQQNNSSGEAFTTTVNLEKFYNFNSSLYFPLDFIGNLDGYGGIIVNNNTYNSNYLDAIFNKSKWSFTGVLNIQFKLPFDINTEVSAYYSSGDQEGIMDVDWLYGVGFSINKNLIKNKLKLTLSSDDIFNRFYFSRINYSNMNANINQKWAAPFFQLSLTYDFGNKYLIKPIEIERSGKDELARTKK